MKIDRLIRLAVFAGLMAVTLMGASAAMAEKTGLCEKDVSPCPADPGELFEHVHAATLGHATLLNSIVDVECNVLFAGDVTSNGLAGNPLAIKGNFTYTNCLNACKAEEKNGPATINVLKEGHELAKVTGEGLVLVYCNLFGLHCTYDGENLLGHALGALLAEGHPNGQVRVENATVHVDPGEKLSFCPSEAKLDFLIGVLAATYIRS